MQILQPVTHYLNQPDVRLEVVATLRPGGLTNCTPIVLKVLLEAEGGYVGDAREGGTSGIFKNFFDGGVTDAFVCLCFVLSF